MWCKVVMMSLTRPLVKEKQPQARNPKAHRKSAVRASITFPPGLYATLEEIAQEKKVSVAWVVRDASERYVTERSVDATRPGKG
jgi:hypothetical protein